MVWQKYALGLTHDKIAINLCVDKSTVSRTIELFQTSGSVSKRSYPTDRAYRELTSLAQLFILTLVLEQPGIYLHEMQRELKENMMLEVSTSTLCKFLHRSGFSRQRMRAVALQQDRAHREQYIFDVFVYTPECLSSWMRLGLSVGTECASMGIVYVESLLYTTHYYLEERQ